VVDTVGEHRYERNFSIRGKSYEIPKFEATGAGTQDLATLPPLGIAKRLWKRPMPQHASVSPNSGEG
jgi:hypothetical protein